MGRQLVILALLLFAVIGFASSARPAESPKGSADNGNANVGTILAPSVDDTVGNTDGDTAMGGGDAVVEGPIGEPGAEGATGSAPAESPLSGASTLEFSAVAAVATVAGFSFF